MQKKLYSIDEVIGITGLSRSSIYKARQLSLIKFRKFLGKTVVTAEDLDAFVSSLPEAELVEGPPPQRRVAL